MYIDGASRSNPGPAGAGIFIKSKNKEKKISYYLESKTNNQAEYLALIIGLLSLEDNNINIFSDSELLVRQIKGEYKVKNSNIKELYDFAVELLRKFNYTITHILRDKNQVADKLANTAIDKKVELPHDIKSQLLEKGIQI